MLEHLIDQIASPNTELKKEVNICRLSHSSTFFKAPTYLSTVLERLYLSTNPSLFHFRKHGICSTGRVGRSSRRGRHFNYQ